MSMIRSRWAAVGAAVAITLGAGGVSLTQAAISSGEKPVFVSLDAPCRVIDTRSGSPIGAGDAAALTVQITGANGACTGALAIPADAVGVATNVTVIQPNGAASGRSYFTVYPTGATRPVTSNLNFVNGQAPTPNKVDVGIGTGGQITIYNNEGTAHAAVDIFGYYIDHNHDDIYYRKGDIDTALGTKANAADVTAALATKANAADVTAALATKANAADVYTKGEVDSAVANHLAGTTVRGAINVEINSTAAGQRGSQAISFGVDLAVAPTVHLIPPGGPVPAGCSGTPTNPGADAGHFCVFQQASSNISQNQSCIARTAITYLCGLANTWGTSLFVVSAGAGTTWTVGSWALGVPPAGALSIASEASGTASSDTLSDGEAPLGADG
jgi:hypothetical protein